MLHTAQDINNRFVQYYSSLYSSEYTNDLAFFESFFSKLNLPTVSIGPELGDSIRQQEVMEAIVAMQSGKAPGPDGFPIEFYKKFSALLSPLLVAVYNEAFEKGFLPLTLSQASISLLLKENKNATICESYRPISLLNADFKILAKALAVRLEPILSAIIHNDQTGFIRGRNPFNNLHRLFNVMYTHSHSDAEVIVSLDAEKAFDRVEWEYLFITLKKFGFPEDMISWVKLLYSAPVASVRTNNVFSEYFSLHRGTRQGCPLSPLLFAISIEPLAILLRQSPAFRGITRNGIEHKISLYADDVLLYVSNPSLSLPYILSAIEDFGKISGYKVNMHKTEYFPIVVPPDFVPHSIPFRVVHNMSKYLGVSVTSSFNSLFKANFSPLLKRCKKDFKKWSALPLSLAGRISLIKMMVLPRFLYLHS